MNKLICTTLGKFLLNSQLLNRETIILKLYILWHSSWGDVNRPLLTQIDYKRAKKGYYQSQATVAFLGTVVTCQRMSKWLYKSRNGTKTMVSPKPTYAMVMAHET